MFSGIVKGLGNIAEASKRASKMRLKIKSPVLRSVKIGDSVAVNGVCLTVAAKSPSGVFFDVVAETLSRSTLGALKSGDRVNLELALEWKGRVSGHFVLGHVDAMAAVLDKKTQKSQTSFLIAFPKSLKKYIVEKGSVALHGVSLTVGRVRRNAFWVHLVPHTLKATVFQDVQSGDKLNLEVDYIAKLAIS